VLTAINGSPLMRAAQPEECRLMSEDPDRTRRWLINASGAVILSNALAPGRSYAQVANSPTAKTLDPDGPAADAPISPVTIALSDYVANTLDRDLPPDVVAKTKLHTLDTIAAMISGSRLKAGEMAARYVDSLGGNPQATVVGTSILKPRPSMRRSPMGWRPIATRPTILICVAVFIRAAA
jgi:hypothetical protein